MQSHIYRFQLEDLGGETEKEKVLQTMIGKMKAADGKNGVYYFNGPSQKCRA